MGMSVGGSTPSAPLDTAPPAPQPAPPSGSPGGVAAPYSPRGGDGTFSDLAASNLSRRPSYKASQGTLGRTVSRVGPMMIAGADGSAVADPNKPGYETTSYRPMRQDYGQGTGMPQGPGMQSRRLAQAMSGVLGAPPPPQAPIAPAVPPAVPQYDPTQAVAGVPIRRGLVI